VRDFFAAIWGELDGRYGEIRALKDGKARSVFHEESQFAEADALVLSTLGHDVYFGVLPRLEKDGKGSAIADTSRVIWADFDAKTYVGKEQSFQAVASVAPEPQIVVDSGHGYHAYWLLDRDYPFEGVREVMKGIAVVTGADPKTHDKARILRVPGTENHKDPTEVLPVRLLRFNLMARRHRLSDFVGYAEAGMPAPRQAQRPTLAQDSVVTGWSRSSESAPKYPDGTRNNSLAQVAGIMYARGLTEDEVLEELSYENEVRCDPPLDQAEVEAIARSLARYAR
jgi:hypothetical protein